MSAIGSLHFSMGGAEGRSRRKMPGGFTLIEIIMAIVLASILGVFSMQFVSQATRATQLTQDQKDLVDEGKLALEYMVRELRVASEKNSAGTTTNVIVQTATSIKFDKLTSFEQDANKCQIEYSYDSVNKLLKRTTHTGGDAACTLASLTGTTTTTLASRVTSFTITEDTVNDPFYYVITMTLTAPEGSVFQLESAVRPRSKA